MNWFWKRIFMKYEYRPQGIWNTLNLCRQQTAFWKMLLWRRLRRHQGSPWQKVWLTNNCKISFGITCGFRRTSRPDQLVKRSKRLRNMHNFLFKIIKTMRRINPRVWDQYGKVAGIVGILSNTLPYIMKIIVVLFPASYIVIARCGKQLQMLPRWSRWSVSNWRPCRKTKILGHARIEYLAGFWFPSLSLRFELSCKVLSPRSSLRLPRSSVKQRLSVILLFYTDQSLAGKIQYFCRQKIDSDVDCNWSINSVMITNPGQFCSVFLNGHLRICRLTASQVCLLRYSSGLNQPGNGTVSLFSGRSPDPRHKDIEQIHLHDGVLGIHDLVVHNYGPGKIFYRFILRKWFWLRCNGQPRSHWQYWTWHCTGEIEDQHYCNHMILSTWLIQTGNLWTWRF